MDIREPEVPSLVLVSQPCVVYPQAMQDGSLQIVNVHRIGGDVVPIIVRLPEDYTRPKSAARHPNRETPRMMVPAILVRRQPALAVYGPPELAAPNN